MRMRDDPCVHSMVFSICYLNVTKNVNIKNSSLKIFRRQHTPFSPFKKFIKIISPQHFDFLKNHLSEREIFKLTFS